ncbi:hypothetical protein [Paenibacillus sp. FSL K6-1230]|uniref:hypothetical protein n=1 Tax=Paenibacillus sp. FSL K6-1230 TaxID=2921603 RepID=UPI00039CBA69
MDTGYDSILMVCIAAGLLIWGYVGLRYWLEQPRRRQMEAIPLNNEIQPGPAVDILEKAGYEVVGGKMRIPLAFLIDKETVHSRLYMDYIAVMDDDTYMVKTSRRKQPMEWSGPEMRDKYLSLMLIYPSCAGILYVDTDQESIKRIVLAEDHDLEMYDTE